MGQNNTSLSPKSQALTKISNTEEKLKFALFVKGQVPDAIESEGGPCFKTFCKQNSYQKDDRWIKFMTRQLERCTLEEWPQILLTILRRYNSNELDEIYQADVQWNAYHETETNPLAKSYEFRNKQQILFNDSPDEEQMGDKHMLLNRQDQDHVDKRTRAMTAFVSDTYAREPEWIRESYDIRVSEDREAMIASSHLFRANRSFSYTIGLNHDGIRTRKKTYSHYENLSLLQENVVELPTFEYSNSSQSGDLLKYKSILNVIQRHITREKIIFKKLIKKFESHFVKYYSKIAEDHQKGIILLQAFNSHVAKATKDTQMFIGILYETIVMYYSLDKIKADQSKGCGKFLNRDNLISFLTSILFKGKVYTTLFQLYCLQDADTEKMYQKSANLCLKFKPEDFGVSDQYCLNQRTIEWLNKQRPYQNSEGISSQIVMVLLEDEDKNIRIGRQGEEENQNANSKNENDIDGKNETVEFSNRQLMRFDTEKPFESAINSLRRLKNKKSPLHKLKSIVKTAEQMSMCIKEFYGEFGLINQNKLDPDQTLSLFMYIAVQSRLENLAAHCRIIEKFSTNNILNSVSGYYSATLGACVAYVCDIDLKGEDGLQRLSAQKGRKSF